MTYQAYLKFLFVFMMSGIISAQEISIGERHSFSSEILNEQRSYQVYLPPSYHENPEAKFPVIYVLDGDYNFHYDSGLIEFLSNSAFTIPEAILIGISDNGSTKQLENSDPKKNADTFIRYIQSELKPKINTSYRTSHLDILIGHSKFGILATHYWMTNPKDFDVFLAIDPSYWFNDYEIVKRLESELQNGFTTNSKLYIAQANTKGMGIDELVSVLQKESPEQTNWHLNSYPEDNHGSLHLKAITDVLNTVFKGWDLNRETFYSFKNGNDVINHYKVISDRYDSEFLLPWYSLGNITYYYIRQNKTEDLAQMESGIKTHFPASLEQFHIQLANNYLSFENLEEAEKRFKVCLFANPDSYKALEGLSKIAAINEDTKTAINYLEQSIAIAKDKQVRQYYLNELKANLNQLKQ
ncbi:alpha/beta hydrolase-fold protein [Psychroserpens algicola]|uniref:alpha/beta hydrolase-fold protein n=1 Tax=Psychroserpens algicola TaxID=1719034 RepID=UPI001953F800|nr:alpha/beta hydrolase-fold protein [Psychroserpens algicola]